MLNVALGKAGAEPNQKKDGEVGEAKGEGTEEKGIRKDCGKRD